MTYARAKSPGAPMRLVAGERHGRRWEMTPRPGDLPEIQALLDRVDGRLSHETSGHAMPAMSVRLAAVMAVVMGLAAGVPFAILFAAAQRVRPDAPGAAVALVNACGVATILVGTPLAGLAFDLPGDGAVAFAAIACLAAAALFALRRASL